MSQADSLDEIRIALALRGEYPMTLIVSLFGRDGWVLASDTLAQQTLPVTEHDRLSAGTFNHHTRKITRAAKANLIFGCAGSHLSRLAGESISRAASENPDIKTNPLALTQLANGIYQKYHTPQFGLEIDIPSLVLIFTHPPLKSWTIRVRATSEVCESVDKQLLGDLHNGAKLFPALYFSRRPTHSLTLLAAHTILAGHQYAPSVIDGLDIWTGDFEGNVRQLASDELTPLIDRSKSIDAIIRQEFDS